MNWFFIYIFVCSRTIMIPAKMNGLLMQKGHEKFSQILNSLAIFKSCNSGQLIMQRNFCDGRIHCRDGSDETAAFCKHIKCESDKFRCRYGGCVSNMAICSGHFDCADGSDEDVSLCHPTHCSVPPNTKNTAYFVADYEEKPLVAKEYSALQYFCTNNDYKKGRLAEAHCKNGSWFPKIPICERETKFTPSTHLYVTILSNETSNYDPLNHDLSQIFGLPVNDKNSFSPGAWNVGIPQNNIQSHLSNGNQVDNKISSPENDKSSFSPGAWNAGIPQNNIQSHLSNGNQVDNQISSPVNDKSSFSPGAWNAGILKNNGPSHSNNNPSDVVNDKSPFLPGAWNAGIPLDKIDNETVTEIVTTDLPSIYQ